MRSGCDDGGKRRVVVYWHAHCPPRIKQRIRRRFGIIHETVNGESVVELSAADEEHFEAVVRLGWLTVRWKPVPPPFVRKAGAEDGADG